jgi:hypothetical protein
MLKVIYRRPSYAPFKIYWDEGEHGIQAFKDGHEKGCLTNEFCNGLGLRNSDEPDGFQSLRAKSKRPLRYGKFRTYAATTDIER